MWEPDWGIFGAVIAFFLGIGIEGLGMWLWTKWEDRQEYKRAVKYYRGNHIEVKYTNNTKRRK